MSDIGSPGRDRRGQGRTTPLQANGAAPGTGADADASAPGGAAAPPRLADAGQRAAQAAAETAARRSYGRLLAWLAARTRDLSAAEDALADAFAAALATWPSRGVPQNPEGWLAVAARRRLIGAARHQAVAARAAPALELLSEERMALPDPDAPEAPSDSLPDERLKLMFAVAHPAIDPRMHMPLMLQCVLGFDAAAIARACLIAPATMGQRLSRAKAKIRAAGIPFALPSDSDVADRLDPVLDAIYVAFGLAWDDPDGRRELAQEALWLGDLVARCMPNAAEAQGLPALMRFAYARRAARRDAQGGFVPLDEQETALWDGAMIAQAERDLARAAALRQPGRFQLEAAIQAVHADRARTGRTDWAALSGLYRLLWRVAPTMATLCGEAAVTLRQGGPAEALARLEAAADAARDYQPWWAVRAEALRQLGRSSDASAAARHAAALTPDAAARRWLLARAGGPAADG
ncbi:MAG: DUF6596 domain-containing protein [Pseudomonadota bacterium]